MKTLKMDLGIQEFQIGDGGVLRFNPSDPNLYSRFLGATDRIGEIDKEFAEKIAKVEGDGAGGLRLLREYDMKAKAILSEIFGPENDFDRILLGANVLSVGANGKRLIENLFDALLPVFEEGAGKCARAKAQKALEQAKINRAQSRTAERK